MNPVESILPIILLLMLGGFLAARGFVKPSFWDELSKFVYWVALPSYIIAGLLQPPSADATEVLFPMRSLGIFAGATLLIIPLGLLVAKGLKLPFSQWGVFLQVSFRGNLAFVSLPVLQYAFGDETA